MVVWSANGACAEHAPCEQAARAVDLVGREDVGELLAGRPGHELLGGVVQPDDRPPAVEDVHRDRDVLERAVDVAAERLESLCERGHRLG